SRLVREVMVETEAVAARLGIELPISIDQRMAGAEKVGAHKTSMLQDLEAGRPMELEAVVGAVVDSVSDVMELAPDQIREAPEIDSGDDAAYITGLGTLNDRMLILLAIEKLMGASEMALVDQV
ncbi:MAG: ketopantoate reductase C-terminal domain-containing protein, partial [Burkholderiaceae bacterium]